MVGHLLFSKAFTATRSTCKEDLSIATAQQGPMTTCHYLPDTMDLPYQYGKTMTPAASQTQLTLFTSTKC